MRSSAPTGRERSADPIEARLTAAEVASQAGVDVRLVEDLDELGAIEALFERIWGPGVTVPLLRTLTYTGNYVAGAWIQTHLIGASIGMMNSDPQRRILHIFMSGVAPAAQGSGVGYALKCHERAWSLSHQIDEITWNFDPLSRRNGRFGLVKLGARAVAYYANFFGQLNDPLNRWDVTDRCLARWDLRLPGPSDAGPADIKAATAGGAVPYLAEGDDRQPRVLDLPASSSRPRALLCQVPADAAALRRVDPRLAEGWRSALRDTLGEMVSIGYVGTHMTADGWYLLERDEPSI